MGEEMDAEVRLRLQMLHGRMAALSDAIHILGEESGRVAAIEPAGPDAGPDERLASAEGLAAASLEAVRGCANRINALFEAANIEFEEIKMKLAPGQNGLTH